MKELKAMETLDLVVTMETKKNEFALFINKYWDALPDKIKNDIYDNLQMEYARIKILYEQKKDNQIGEKQIKNEVMRVINNLTSIDNKYFKGRIFSEQ